MGNRVAFHSLHPEGILVEKDGIIRIGDAVIDFNSVPSSILGRYPTVETVSFFGGGSALARLPAYRGLLLEGIYPFIDAELLFVDGDVELQFLIHPGGDPRDIVLSVSGASIVEENGKISLRSSGGMVRIGDIKAYQGVREFPVEVSIRGDTISFSVEGYDGRWPLVIDPVFTAVIASPQNDYGFSMAVGGDGSVLVAGATLYSYMFAPDRFYFGSVNGRDAPDVFVTKLSPDLSTHIATAIIGSCGWDYARDVKVGADGSIYVAGWTSCSSSFAPDRVFFGDTGGVDVFVSRLSPSLDEHLATAIVSSGGSDYAYGLSVGPDGGIYVAGYTDDYSTFAPVRVVFGETGSYDAFVSNLSADLSLHFNTAILGSGGMDGALNVEVDDSGNVFLSGYTWSPETFAPNRVFFGNPGSMDAFVSKLSSDLNVHFSSAILSSPGLDSGNALYISGSGRVYVGGWTDSAEEFAPWRTVVGNTGGLDGFVSALSSDMNEHLGSIVLASAADDGVEDVVMYDSLLALSGYTEDGSGFASGGVVIGTTGGSDAFVALIDTALLHVSSVVILASDSDDVARSIGASGGGIYVAGNTRGTSGFVEGAVRMGAGGALDVFVSRLDYPVSMVGEGSGGDVSITVQGHFLEILLKEAGYVGVEIYGVDGRRIHVAGPGFMPSGIHRIPIPSLRSGVYMLILRIGNRSRHLRIVIN